MCGIVVRFIAAEAELEIAEHDLDFDIAEQKSLRVLIALLRVHHSIAPAVAAMDEGSVSPLPAALSI